MGESAHQEIVRQLTDNAADIISASANDGPERLAALAHRQKALTQALNENTFRFTQRSSRASVGALQDLVAKAVDAVRIEIVQNRGSLHATGIKKKVLRAYGSVTVSGASEK